MRGYVGWICLLAVLLTSGTSPACGCHCWLAQQWSATPDRRPKRGFGRLRDAVPRGIEGRPLPILLPGPAQQI